MQKLEVQNRNLLPNSNFLKTEANAQILKRFHRITFLAVYKGFFLLLWQNFISQEDETCTVMSWFSSSLSNLHHNITCKHIRARINTFTWHCLVCHFSFNGCLSHRNTPGWSHLHLCSLLLPKLWNPFPIAFK